MAKQKVTPLADASSFSAINSFIGQFDSDGEIAETYTPLEIGERIDTGSYIYNAHISGSLRGGITPGKITVYAGDPKTGKSYLLLNNIREGQQMGYFTWMVETENSPDKDRFVSQGIDPKGVRITQPDTAAEMTEMFIQFTDPLIKLWRENKALKQAGKPPKHVMPKIMIAIDSLSGFISTKQYSDAGEGEIKQDRGFTANEMSVFMKMATKRCGKLGIPMVCTLHTTEAQAGQMKIKKPTGALAIIFMASVVVLLEKKKEYDKDTEQYTGIEITSRIYESRFSKYNKVHIYIRFKGALNRFIGMEDYVSWDVCGIDRGKFVDLVDVAYELLTKKLVDKSTLENFSFDMKYLEKNLSKAKLEGIEASIGWLIENGYIIEKPEFNKDSKLYILTSKFLSNYENDKYSKIDAKVGIVNKASNNVIVKHLGRTVTPQEYFSALVFTPEVIENLDEKVIKPKFQLSSTTEVTEDDETEEISTLNDFYKLAEQEAAEQAEKEEEAKE